MAMTHQQYDTRPRYQRLKTMRLRRSIDQRFVDETFTLLPSFFQVTLAKPNRSQPK